MLELFQVYNIYKFNSTSRWKQIYQSELSLHWYYLHNLFFLSVLIVHCSIRESLTSSFAKKKPGMLSFEKYLCMLAKERTAYSKNVNTELKVVKN